MYIIVNFNKTQQISLVCQLHYPYATRGEILTHTFSALDRKFKNVVRQCGILKTAEKLAPIAQRFQFQNILDLIFFGNLFVKSKKRNFLMEQCDQENNVSISVP